VRIFYVEDNLANVGLVERICRMHRDELMTFRDAESAIPIIEAEKGKIDLIFVDLNLGRRGMNGLDLVRNLREKGIKAPVVALTAYDFLGYGDKYQEAGCDAYVRKPIAVRELVDLIDKYRHEAAPTGTSGNSKISTSTVPVTKQETVEKVDKSKDSDTVTVTDKSKDSDTVKAADKSASPNPSVNTKPVNS